MAGFTPKRKELPSNGGGDFERKPFVTPVPKKGLRQVAVSFLVSLGIHKNDPFQRTEEDGTLKWKDVEQEDGTSKRVPDMYAPKPVEQMGVYVDMLQDEWDYGDKIGVQQIRMPLHSEFQGRIEKDGGINFNETGHGKDKAGNWIKLPWTLAGNSRWAKIAEAVEEERILDPGTYEKDNPYRSDISLLLGKPFMMNAVIKKTKGVKTVDGVETDVEYTNVSLKAYAPLMEGLPAAEMKAEPLALNFYSPVEEIVKNIRFFRPAVIKKIMTALDYDNINFDDDSAEEVPSNMKLAFEQAGVNANGYINDKPSDEPQEAAEEKPKAKAKPKTKAASREVQQPVEDAIDFDDDVPFSQP